MEFFTVILIIALLAILIILLMAFKKRESVITNTKPSFVPNPQTTTQPDGNSNGYAPTYSANEPNNTQNNSKYFANKNQTFILPDLYIDQLSAKNQKPIKTFEVSIWQLQKRSLSISGCCHDYEEGKLVVEKTPDACTVSDCHITIGYDDKGFFCKEVRGSRNGVYRENSVYRMNIGEAIPVEHGMLLRLGSQWIRFRLSKYLLDSSESNIENDDTTIVKGKEIPVTLTR